MKPRCLQVQNSELQRVYPEDFAIVDQALEICDIILYGLGERRMKEADLSDYQKVLLAICYKMNSSILSLASLCSRGLVQDANTIARKLLESAVSMEYLSFEPDQRSVRVRRFCDHGTVQLYHYQLRNIENILSNPEIQRLAPHFLQLPKQIRAEYELKKSSFPVQRKGLVQGDYRSSWSGMSIPEMAYKVGKDLWEDIFTMYYVFCVSTHTSIADVDAFYDPVRLVFGPRAQDEENDPPLLLLFGSRMLLRVARLVGQAFDMDIAESIDTVRSVIGKREKALAKQLGCSD